MSQAKSCAFLSMDNLENFECYDRLLFEPLQEHGWEAEEVSWRNNSVNWNKYDAVIVRSPWDYQDDPDAFLSVLEKIEQSSAHLENSLDLITWNIDKRYLKELQQQGAEIVPTLWEDRYQSQNLSAYFDELNTTDIIIKPTISAGAEDTFLISRAEAETYQAKLADVFDNQAFMIQPFMNSIKTEGEFSIFFFGDTYSHTVLKTPESDDFRVQEEHGGRLQKVEPEQSLIDSTLNVLHKLQPEPLYTRVDFVRTSKNTFALMELELIEPSLYFNMDSDSPRRFARVFDHWMKTKTLN